MGRRSRKRDPATRARVQAVQPQAPAGPFRPRPPAANGGSPPQRLRGEAANEAVRAQLEPLARGERPAALKVAIAVCLVVAIGNPVFALAGWEIQGADPSFFQTALLSVLLIGCAVYMWRLSYGAVLGFQAFLGISLVWVGLSLPFASNWWGVALCVVTLGLGGWLFWRLVRVLSRLQAPRRPTTH